MQSKAVLEQKTPEGYQPKKVRLIVEAGPENDAAEYQGLAEHVSSQLDFLLERLGVPPLEEKQNLE